MRFSPKDKLCIALDVDDSKKARSLVKKLADHTGFFKIGFQLFTSEGPKIIKVVHDYGGKVFLDLKFHDIPNTVANAAVEAMKLGVSIFNIHASGGLAMMEAVSKTLAVKSKDLRCEKPRVLAVTVLTSLNDKNLNDELRVPGSVADQVLHLAGLTKRSGLDGVVASPLEIAKIRKKCGPNFIILTPGIRPAWSSSDDQKRVMTPKEAIKAGANIIVIGRPIIGASDPVDAAKRVLDEMAN